MKQLVSILILILLTQTMSFGQQGQRLFHSEFEQTSFLEQKLPDLLFASHSSVNHTKYNEYFEDLECITSKLNKKRDKWGEERLIEKLFFNIHRKYLKWYENYVSLGDVFLSGKYDCVTGTALYALALNKLDLPYTIYEFDYHTFLVVHLEDQEILLESTDPYNGVVSSTEEIKRRISIYSIGQNPIEINRPVGSDKETYSNHINTTIDIKEIAGLQYFNLAVKAFNEHNTALAADMIEKAYMLYPSKRISGMRKIFTRQNLLTTR